MYCDSKERQNLVLNSAYLQLNLEQIAMQKITYKHMIM